MDWIAKGRPCRPPCRPPSASDVEQKAEKWFIRDDEIPRFGLVVMPSVVKSYILRRRTNEARDRRPTLGRRRVLTPDQVRTKARETLVAANDRGDPLAERRNRRAGVTMFPRVGDPTRPLAAPVMQRPWQRIRKQNGLTDVHPHDQRHTLGTTASRSGGNAFQFRDVPRHSDIAMSARYGT